MRKFLLCVVLSGILGLPSFAQSFLTQHAAADDSVLSNFINTAGYTESKNLIKNNSFSDQRLRWKIVQYDLPQGWELAAFCDNTNCHTDVLSGSSKETGIIPPDNYISDFRALFLSGNAPKNSIAWIKVEVSNPAYPGDTRLLTFLAAKGTPTSIGGIKPGDDSVAVFPNPVRNTLNIVYGNQAGIKSLAIYNLIGKQVGAYKVSGGSAKVDVDHLPSGVYFIRLSDANGRVVATRKFTRQ